MLDSGATISVLNYPTYLTIAKLLNITCNNETNHTSKTLTVENQTEVPILHYVTTTLNTSIEQTCGQFIMPLLLPISIIIFLALPSLKTTYKTLIFKTLHYSLNVTPKINQTPLNLHLYYQKTIHIAPRSTESILEHKYAYIQTPQNLKIYQ